MAALDQKHHRHAADERPLERSMPRSIAARLIFADDSSLSGAHRSGASHPRVERSQIVRVLDDLVRSVVGEPAMHHGGFCDLRPLCVAPFSELIMSSSAIQGVSCRFRAGEIA
jgi:hypothetical protein